MPAAMVNALSARASVCKAGSRQLLTMPARVLRPRAAPGARADAFGGVSRFFAATPRRGEASDGDDAPTRAAAYPAQVAVSFAADTAAFTAQSSAIEAELGLEPFSNSASAAIAAMMQRAEAEAAAKAGAVPDARDTAQRRAQALREAVELATARATDVNTRILDENQARAEALVRLSAHAVALGHRSVPHRGPRAACSRPPRLRQRGQAARGPCCVVRPRTRPRAGPSGGGSCGPCACGSRIRALTPLSHGARTADARLR